MALSPHTIVAVGWISIFVGSFFFYSNAHGYLAVKRKEVLRQRRAEARQNQLKDKESNT